MTNNLEDSEITIGEVEGKLVHIKDSNDQNIIKYINAEGLAFPRLYIPSNIKYPHETKFGKRKFLSASTSYEMMPHANFNLFSLIERSKTWIEEKKNQISTLNLGNILPSFISILLFNKDVDHYIKSLRERINNSAKYIFAWHPRCSLFAIAHKADAIYLYDLRVEAWFPEVLETELQREITCMAWKPFGSNLLAVGCRRGICLWELSLNQNINSGDTSTLTTGSLDGSIILWNTTLEIGTPIINNCNVNLLVWSPLGNILFATYLGGLIEVWETQRWTSKKFTVPFNKNDSIKSACWTKDGHAVFLILENDYCVRSVTISPNLDFEWLVETNIADIPSCSEDSVIDSLAIDPTGERLVANIDNNKYIIVFKANRPTLVTRINKLLTFQDLIRGPSWYLNQEDAIFQARPDPVPISINFANQFKRGALLSVVNICSDFGLGLGF
ncbi:3217_t:CDS:10 [Entrophospora sp. SA101]|nr:3217_t:CDS:10 [Entrophospora sp. SA101]CAJ0824233.1 11934_t:CDS:10 [Entrophospora sp. SA101]CAJ0909331.1 8643_t:CDS:10 [Entrophospora sp. SA101]CAJ0927343.1 21279_t:CDS:10 [Entrophospora sp. SA101]